jgi:hypothetical protein
MREKKLLKCVFHHKRYNTCSNKVLCDENIIHGSLVKVYHLDLFVFNIFKMRNLPFKEL